MPKYIGLRLQNDLTITTLYSVHYFEYMKDYSYEGESHDFWEITYVDKGEIEVCVGEKEIVLQQGEILFIKPNVFHNLRANGIKAPNLVVISFDCRSKAMQFFQDKVLKISTLEREFFSEILIEARRAISSPLNVTYLYELKRQAPAQFGSEQLIRLYLEYIFIALYRRNNPQAITNPTGSHTNKKFTSIKQEYEEDKIYEKIITYMQEHNDVFLTIEEICRDNLVSKSQLQDIFARRHNCGVIHYFIILKIEHAKQLIREQKLNFTEISEKLGYYSLHYFSRQFKTITGMSATEYCNSVKAGVEKQLPAGKLC